MSKKPLIVWASDLHINSLVGLCPPVFRREQGGEHIFSRAQRDLWDCWIDAWKEVNGRKRDVVLILGGDIVDLDIKKRSTQLISRNQAEILQAAGDALAPALERAGEVIVIRGTEAHVGNEGYAEEMLAKDLDNVFKDGEAYSWYYCRVKIGGKLFDLAHHVSMGRLPWTERNAANKLASIVIAEYADWGEAKPDWVLRGHVHRVSDSGINFGSTRAVVCPCWSLGGVYEYRLGNGAKKPEIGLMVIDPEKSEPEWLRYAIKRPSPSHIG